MKFQYLGTAAYEGIPAFFCNCENCKKSRSIGGRAIRTRSQAIIDDTLLIDFPADTYMHTLVHNIDLLNVKYCLITHTHSDHFYPEDIGSLREGFAHTPDGYHLQYYGSKQVSEAIAEKIEFINSRKNTVDFCEVKPFETVQAGEYQITALPAIHDVKSGPLFYMIEKEGNTILYGNDTHYFDESVWEYFKENKPCFSMVSLDCTNACLPLTYVGHMGLEENIKVKTRMMEEGYADENTIFICNHFSHNGIHVVYDEFVPIAGKEGFLVSYDGMVVNI